MRKRVGYLFLLVALITFSCQKQVESTHTFFDSLAIASTQFLIKQKAFMHKEVHIGTQLDTIQMQPDSTYLANDLDVFRQLAAFQKPAYRDAYHMEDGLTDGQSNLSIRQFKAIKKTPIPVVRFYYHRHFRHLKKIEAEYKEENALYSTARHLIMEFEEIKGTPILSYYSMEGYQKMILSDSTLYSVHSSISF